MKVTVYFRHNSYVGPASYRTFEGVTSTSYNNAMFAVRMLTETVRIPIDRIQEVREFR